MKRKKGRRKKKERKVIGPGPKMSLTNIGQVLPIPQYKILIPQLPL